MTRLTLLNEWYLGARCLPTRRERVAYILSRPSNVVIWFYWLWCMHVGNRLSRWWLWIHWEAVIPAAQYVFGTCDWLRLPGHRLRLWIWRRL